jgi:hypothetical protein
LNNRYLDHQQKSQSQLYIFKGAEAETPELAQLAWTFIVALGVAAILFQHFHPERTTKHIHFSIETKSLSGEQFRLQNKYRL